MLVWPGLEERVGPQFHIIQHLLVKQTALCHRGNRFLHLDLVLAQVHLGVLQHLVQLLSSNLIQRQVLRQVRVEAEVGPRGHQVRHHHVHRLKDRQRIIRQYYILHHLKNRQRIIRQYYLLHRLKDRQRIIRQYYLLHRLKDRQHIIRYYLLHHLKDRQHIARQYYLLHRLKDRKHFISDIIYCTA